MPNYSNGRGGRRFHSRRRRHRALSLPLLLGALLLALVVVALAFFLRRPKRNGPAASASDADQSVEETTVAKLTSEEILADAAKKAAQYDYDAAIAAIEADEKTAHSEPMSPELLLSPQIVMLSAMPYVGRSLILLS